MKTDKPEQPEKPVKPDEHPDKPVKYSYFLDSVKIDSDTSSVTGANVRAKLPPEKAGYALYLEGHGNESDRLVNDSDSFSLEKKLRFYSVPPATFGAA